MPIPMENIPEKATKKAGQIAEFLDSEVFVTYIIQEDIFDEVAKQSTHVITPEKENRFAKRLKNYHRQSAQDNIKPEINEELGDNLEDFSISEGTYDQVILDRIKEMDIDLVMLEYDSFNMMKYRIMENSPVPIWIVRDEEKINNIGLFCTNLAPNKMAPKVAKKLAEKFDAKLISYYINDRRGRKMDDEPGKIEKEFNITFNKIMEEDIETGLYRIAKNDDLDLIVLGRIKKLGYFNMRSKFAKKTHCSVLLIN